MFEPRKKIAKGNVKYDEEDITEYSYEITVRGSQIIVLLSGDDIIDVEKSFDAFIGDERNPETKAKAATAFREERPPSEANYRIYVHGDTGVKGLCRRALEKEGFTVWNGWDS